jgi:hypothetical protein
MWAGEEHSDRVTSDKPTSWELRLLLANRSTLADISVPLQVELRPSMPCLAQLSSPQLAVIRD